MTPSDDWLARLKLIEQECLAETGMDLINYLKSEPTYYDEEYGWRVKPEYKDLESLNQAKGRE